jgi:hypothetical protein
MTNRRWIIVVLAVLVLPALACSFSLDLGGETPSPEETVVASPPPTEITPQPQEPTPTVAGPTGPSFSDLVFAAEVTDDGEPTAVATEFPEGTTIIYAAASYEGMSDGAQCESVWYLDGEESARNPFDWNLGESGSVWIANLANEDGLLVGQYNWELYVEGEEVISGAFVVGAPSALIFSDDFADAGSGWEVGDYDSGSVGYKNGAYFVTSLGGGDTMWGVANRVVKDLVIEVDATQVSAPANDNNGYGVGCRVQSDGDGYYLVVSGDGMYSITKVEGGEFDRLVDWTESEAIQQGNATNHIQAVCDGADLILTVNGEKMAEATDSTFVEGDIAFAATSYEDEATEIHFDNLAVRQP